MLDAMLDYEVLCQAITDWRAGRRPSVPPPTTDPGSHAPAYGAAPVVEEEEVDSGMLEDEELADASEGASEDAGYDGQMMYGAPSSHDTLPGPRATDVDVDVE
jgi:hypothetical protein